MGSFSVWHWLIVFVVVALIYAQTRQVARNSPSGAGGNLVHSITAYVIAALHDGSLSAQTTIDRLADRHRAKLPELGIDTEKVLAEAKIVRLRNYIFGTIYLGLSLWLIENLLSFPLIEQGDLRTSEYVNTLLAPLLAIAALGIIKTLVINTHLRKKISSIDEPIKLEFSENVIIFGGFSPFAGFGDDLDSWSFTIDTTRPIDDSPKQPGSFTQKELLDFVALRLQGNIASSFTSDLSFVSGRNIRTNAKFLANYAAEPINRVAAEDIQAEVGRPDSTWRHYRSLTVPIAGGHLALTFFLRSTSIGANAFIESRCFILSPIRPEYTSLNDLATRSGVGYLFRLTRSKLLLSPFSWISGSLQSIEGISRVFRFIRWSIFGDPEDKLKKRNVSYNYGNVNSFRESLASNTYQTYFQIIDKDRIAKTVQYITLNSIVDFLEARGVATDEIKERRTQIFNSGVIISGGVLNAQQLAVGSGAKAKVSSVMSAFKPKGVADVK